MSILEFKIRNQHAKQILMVHLDFRNNAFQQIRVKLFLQIYIYASENTKNKGLIRPRKKQRNQRN